MRIMLKNIQNKLPDRGFIIRMHFVTYLSQKANSFKNKLCGQDNFIKEDIFM